MVGPKEMHYLTRNAQGNTATRRGGNITETNSSAAADDQGIVHRIKRLFMCITPPPAFVLVTISPQNSNVKTAVDHLFSKIVAIRRSQNSTKYTSF